MIRILIVALGFTVACSGGGDSGPSKDKGPAPAATGSKTKAPATKTAPVEPAPVVVTAAQLKAALPKTIGLPIGVQALNFSQSKVAVQAAVPGLSATGRMPLPGAEGVELRVGYYKESAGLRYVQLAIPRGAVDGVKSAWGEGLKVRAGGGRSATWWLDPVGRKQAVLTDRGGDEVLLEIWPLLSWSRLLGAERATLGFIGKPLLGLSTASVLSATELRPRRIAGGQIELRLPPTQLQTRPTRVVLHFEEDRVTQVRFALNIGKHRAALADVEAALTAKLGEPTGQEKTRRVWKGTPTITVSKPPQVDLIEVVLTAG